MSKHITDTQRYTIQVMKEQGHSNIAISKIIGIDKTNIGREVKRNCDVRSGKYTSNLAVRKRKTRQKERPRFRKFTKPIEERTVELLRLDYSPEQVVGILEKQGEETMSIEYIYRHLWSDKKAGGDLYTHLRRKGRKYHKRGSSKLSRGIVGRVDIKYRPTVVEARERFGDLEVDLIIGKDHRGAILTINDRASGVLKMCKVPSKEAQVVSKAMCKLLEEWSPYLSTITSDNGREFADHMSVTQQLRVPCYFATPYHSWERGSNENLNGLEKQYIPKKSSFELLTHQDILKV